MATPSGRLPRHPELPPLNIEDNSGPRLADYLEKPRLVRTGGRRPHKLDSEVSGWVDSRYIMYFPLIRYLFTCLDPTNQ